MGVQIFLLRSSPSKLTSFDRELNSERSTTTFRLSTGHGANPDKKYNIFMFKKWVKKTVFYPKPYFLLDGSHRNRHRSIENQILHPLQPLRESSQIQERMSAGNTRIRC